MYKTILMKIQKLTLEGFRGFKEKVEFELHPNVNVFVGVNGSGKTSVLDAAGLLLEDIVKTKEDIVFQEDDLSIGSRSGSIGMTILTKNQKEASFHITIDLDREENSDFAAEFNYSYGNKNINVFNAIAYYKTNRFLQKETNLNDLHTDLFVTNFNSFSTWYIDEENDENRKKLRNNPNYQNPRLTVVRDALNSFFDQIKSDNYSNLYVEMIRNEDNPNSNSTILTHTYSTILLIEKNNTPFKLNNLSDGEKMVILLISDIARRLTIAYSDEVSPEGILKQPGIVLIDEIDLHLHPSWQRDIIPALTHVFPKVQFLFTTHSQQVLSNVRKDSVHIIENFKKVPLTPSIYGADSNSILWDIFGVKKRPDHSEKIFSRFYRSIENSSKEESLKMLQEIENLYGKERLDVKEARLAFQFEYDEHYEV